MTEITPQEIAVWYVLPSIRKELSKELVKKGMSQKKVSETIGVTEAAISQYLKQKRADEIEFTKAAKEKIGKAAQRIKKEPKNARKIIYQLSNEFMGAREVCKVHFKHDKTLSKGCKICFER